MNQYCRYCAFLSHGDAYYCGIYKSVLSSKNVKAKNKCKDFEYCDLGDVDTGKQYKPRNHKKHKDENENEQLKMVF